MRRVLVIGCGGSGGATLRFMMDQLRAELGAAGIDELPAGWQFAHVDVPTDPDAGPGQLGSVEQLGGTYVSLAQPGAGYSAYASTVDEMMRKNGGANAIASWRPEPRKVGVPTSMGAGQYRAVGRIITLASASTSVYPALQAAWTRLQAANVHTEMHSAASELKTLGIYDPQSQPLIFIVSSMSGGSGASMVLDVARLLKMIPGVESGTMATFLYTPDAFESLAPQHRTGVDANAAAALAELVAMQSSSGDEPDENIKGSDAFDAIGLTGVGLGKGPGRVFPIGRRIGGLGAIIGDGSLDTVYRALGRGLAALVSSGKALKSFAAYDLSNSSIAQGLREQFGWGVDLNALAWGCFGYASLNLGRDRYAEYASQRLARIAVDRLAVGHLQHADNRSGTEQVNQLVANNIDRFLVGSGLAESGRPATHWFSMVALPQPERMSISESIAQQKVDPVIGNGPTGSQISDWLTRVQIGIANQRADVDRLVSAAVKRWAMQWHRRLASAVEVQCAAAIGAFGLPYAIALLERAGQEAQRCAGELAAVAGPVNSVALPQQTQGSVDQLARQKGTMQNSQPLVDSMRKGYRTQLELAVRLRAAAIAAEVLASMVNDLLGPLAAACRAALTDIEAARKAPAGKGGLAELQTSDYAAWPSDDDRIVPARFDHADNEVLLTQSSEFPNWFTSHLQAQESTLQATDVRLYCADRIIRGVWETVGGAEPPGGLVENRARWQPQALVGETDPLNGLPLVAGRASYTVHASPTEVLGRARAFVHRPQQPFADYTSESLHDFVMAEGLTDSERRAREDLLVSKLHAALLLAKPLVGIAPDTVAKVHGQVANQLRYKFSDIPLKELPVADRMLATILDVSPASDNETNFLEAQTGQESKATKIDVFGSYSSSLFPVAFTSFLQPIAARWAATPDYGREQFWQWRRARPLTEALPMGQAQRRCLVGGWLVGRLTGQIRVPSNAGEPSGDAIQVWDSQEGTWQAFPNPLLLSRNEWRGNADILPALLESIVLSLAMCHDSASLRPLRPYTAMRRLFDERQEGPTQYRRPVAAQHIARWISTGKTKTGSSLLDDGDRSAADLTPDARQQLVLDWIAKTRDYYQSAYQRYRSDLSESGLRTRLLALDLSADSIWALDRMEDYTRNLDPLEEDRAERHGLEEGPTI